MTIKAVVFDIGGVLERVDDASWPERWMASWERRLGLDAGAFASGMAEHDPGGNVVTGEVSEAQMRKMYQDALGIDEDTTGQVMREMWDASAVSWTPSCSTTSPGSGLATARGS